MKRMHVNLHVRDLDASIRFYSSLFGAPPAVLKHDYAKWMLEDPRVNFAICAAEGPAGLKHLGVQAETREELAQLRARLPGTGGSIREEGETVCCYAQSDKTWVTDQQGVVWEMFYTHGSAESLTAAGPAADAGPSATSCCAPRCCDEGAPGRSESAARG